jgi:hypothetical protein
MPDVSVVVVTFAVAVSLVTLGGGIYESSVVDPRWPERPELIRPGEGGLNRKHFWIPVHVVFEVLLLVSLVLTWHIPIVRGCLWVALLSHVAMRCWSGFDFIPKALEFERSTAASYSTSAARKWTTRSLFRLPLDGVTCAAMLVALVSLSSQIDVTGLSVHD